jgi:hypothetical protein
MCAVNVVNYFKKTKLNEKIPASVNMFTVLAESVVFKLLKRLMNF